MHMYMLTLAQPTPRGPGFGRHLKNTAVLAPRDGIRNATGY